MGNVQVAYFRFGIRRFLQREGRKRVGPVTPVVGYIAVSAYLGLHAKMYQTCK